MIRALPKREKDREKAKMSMPRTRPDYLSMIKILNMLSS